MLYIGSCRSFSLLLHNYRGAENESAKFTFQGMFDADSLILFIHHFKLMCFFSGKPTHYESEKAALRVTGQVVSINKMLKCLSEF